MPEDCRTLIAEGDFRYRTLAGAERDRVLADVLTHLNSNELSVGGPTGRARWERGWSENLDSFRKQPRNLATLVPKYFRTHQPLRLDQQFIVAHNPNFEYAWFDVFRRWLFRTYCHDAEAIFEFGCGTGLNLAVLASLYPEKRLVGLDWTQASVKIIRELIKTYGWKMESHLFDIFHPDENLAIGADSVVLTIDTLEQTGRNYERFLQYLLKARPNRCVHIEPIVEWYDEQSMVDETAIQFHKRRGYCEGIPNRLRELEQAGEIEILKMKRSYFGSLYIEGYSQLIWRPGRRR